MRPQNISQIIEYEEPEMAIESLEQMLEEEDDPMMQSEILAAKGELLWKLNRRGEAMSAYERGAQLDPDGRCAPLREMSQSIMDFFNTDLLNP